MYHINIILLHPTKTAGTTIKKSLGAKTKRHLLPSAWGNLIEDRKVIVSIRNPYDRVISMYNHFGYTLTNSFSDFLNLVQTSKSSLFYPQHKYHIKGSTIIRTENIEEDYSNFCKENNINKPLQKANITPMKVKKHLTDKEKEVVYSIYKEDFEMFKYVK